MSSREREDIRIEADTVGKSFNLHNQRQDR